MAKCSGAACVRATAAFVLAATALTCQGQDYDIVFKGGRVIDPESMLDAIRDVAVGKGKILSVSESPLSGRTEIDARGLVLGPGFVDLHTHAINVPSFWMQAFDGVTTTLELEAGAFPIRKAYTHAESLRLPLNYGFSASWAAARMVVADGVKGLDGTFDTAAKHFAKPNWSRLLPPEKSAQVVNLLEQEMLDGGLGIGVVIGYAPRTNREEYVAVSRLAAKYDVPTYTHMRSKNTNEPDGAVEGFLETIAVAAGTGARMHMCHINSTSLRKIVDVLPLIEKAQGKKLHVTTEAYPWGAGSTVIGAPFLHPSQLSSVGIKSSDIMYVKTGERPSNDERLAQIQKEDPSGNAVIHYLDEANPEQMRFIDTALLFKDGMIASDAISYSINGKPVTREVWPLPREAYSHPRSAATFTVVIARYVRDQQSMSLIDLFRRASLLPADLLATASSDARQKGRIQPGMDADIVVFDLEKIRPRATYKNPRQPSEGMRYVMVNGQFVIANGELNRDVRPGRPIRSTLIRQ